MGKHIFTGKNVFDAIKKGLHELDEKQENVDIKYIKEGGLFSKAQIEIITKTTGVETHKDIETKKEKKKKSVTKKQVAKNNGDDKNMQEDFVKQVVNSFDPEIDINIEKKNGKEIEISLLGGKASALIGKRGESLYAFQYLLNTIDNTQGRERRVFYKLNIENYREKRTRTLEMLAQRIAKKAIKTGRAQKLEPMNSYERKVIHAELSDKEVKTYSKGEDPNRYLIIEKK